MNDDLAKKWLGKLTKLNAATGSGKPLPLIPFVFHGPRHSLPEVDKIPLADIISKNLDHYRLDADYKHGMHFTALPTAWVSGFDKNASLRIGSSTAWVAEAPGATAGYLEFHGQGLTTFERAMDRDEQLMAVLGTRMLESRKRVSETAAAIELRQSGENSILNTVSLSISSSLTQVLRWVYWWNSTEPIPDAIGPDLVLVTLNNDFSIMHSATEAALRKLDLIDFIPDSQGETQIKTFQGRRVIVDDGCPSRAGTTDGLVYTTYLFGSGAFGMGWRADQSTGARSRLGDA
jgi:hypothetical protein